MRLRGRVLIGLVTAVLAAGTLIAMTPGAPLAQPSAAARAGAPPIMDLAAAQAAAPARTASVQPYGKVTPLTLQAGSVSNNPHLQREVFGFVNASNLGDPYVGYTTWNLSLLSTVAYFGLQVNSGNGNLVTNNTGWTVFHSSTMSSFVNAAHAQGVRVIVSIQIHDFSTSPTNQTCLGLQPASQQNTIQQTVQQMVSAGIDGVNINYEGTITTCADGATNRDELVTFASNMRSAMTSAKPGSYLAIDTFSGAAEDNQEFFNITGLAPSVDSFFVMAYDMDEANYFESPLNCSSYCFNPVSPLNTYRFNVTKSMAQYTALVPASKVILGQPYYGRRGCVANLSGGHEYDISGTNFVSPTYIYASTIATQTGVYNLHAGRDSGDGVSEWNTWYDTDWACNREQYFDDTYALGGKYNVVLQDNLRGVGLFTLDYGGGSPELWSLLNSYFSCTVSLNLATTQSTTEFSVGLSAGSCSVSRFDVQVYDATLGQGWFALKSVPTTAGSGTAIADGYAGHTYDFRARAHSSAGVIGAWSEVLTTQVATTATKSQGFAGLYTLDGWGGVDTDNSGPLATTAYWPNWNIARAAHAWPGGSPPQSGFVLDGWGGLHAYGAPGLTETAGMSGHYWPGWDIARDFAFLPDGSGGVVLDGWGGLHPFHVNGSTKAITVQTTAYWPGWDIARKVVMFADGSGGYVLDGWGGLHPFGINGAPPVSAAKIAQTGYWQGWNIARDVVLVPGDGGHSGYVLDGWGGGHPFHVTTDGSTMPAAITTAYWQGWDIARAMWLLPGSSTAGYTLDGWGGVHAFGGAPALTQVSYWPGWDIARALWGA